MTETKVFLTNEHARFFRETIDFLLMNDEAYAHMTHVYKIYIKAIRCYTNENRQI